MSDRTKLSIWGLSQESYDAIPVEGRYVKEGTGETRWKDIEGVTFFNPQNSELEEIRMKLDLFDADYDSFDGEEENIDDIYWKHKELDNIRITVFK